MGSASPKMGVETEKSGFPGSPMGSASPKMGVETGNPGSRGARWDLLPQKWGWKSGNPGFRGARWDLLPQKWGWKSGNPGFRGARWDLLPQKWGWKPWKLGFPGKRLRLAQLERQRHHSKRSGERGSLRQRNCHGLPARISAAPRTERTAEMSSAELFHAAFRRTARKPDRGNFRAATSAGANVQAPLRSGAYAIPDGEPGCSMFFFCSIMLTRRPAGDSIAMGVSAWSTTSSCAQSRARSTMPVIRATNGHLSVLTKPNALALSNIGRR
ncbi:hypothetical protein ACUXPF_000471 [Sphingomonas sanguinis]